MSPVHRVDAFEIVRRFIALGGQARRVRGKAAISYSYVPVGASPRVRYGATLLPAELVASCERVRARDFADANTMLRRRALWTPTVTPTLAMLDGHLRAIEVHTLDDARAWAEVNTWCRIIELCKTDEAPFSTKHLPMLEGVLERARRQEVA